MADHHDTRIRVAGTRFGALLVAVVVVGAHTGITPQSLTWRTHKTDIAKVHVY